jgi:hypothetical protein
MRRRPSNRLLKIVRTSVAQIEKIADLGPEDPAVAGLKHHLLRSIADFDDVIPPISSEISLIADGPLTFRKNPSDLN